MHNNSGAVVSLLRIFECVAAGALLNHSLYVRFIPCSLGRGHQVLSIQVHYRTAGTKQAKRQQRTNQFCSHDFLLWPAGIPALSFSLPYQFKNRRSTKRVRLFSVKLPFQKQRTKPLFHCPPYRTVGNSKEKQQITIRASASSILFYT